MTTHTEQTAGPQSVSAAKQEAPASIQAPDGYKEYFRHLPVQRKLAVGAADDPLEREADAVAERVMRMPETSFIRRKCMHCEEEALQRKPATDIISRVGMQSLMRQPQTPAAPPPNQSDYDAAVAMLQTKNAAMYAILRLGRIGQVVPVSSQNVSIPQPDKSTTDYTIIETLEISTTGVVTGAVAQFNSQPPDVTLKGTTIVLTLPLKINVKIPVSSQALLAETLYHEGLHMLLYIERTLKDLLGNVPSPFATGTLPSFDVYMTAAQKSARFGPLIKMLDAAIGGVIKKPQDAIDARDRIVREVVEEQFAVDMQKAQFPASKVTTQPVGIASQYVESYLKQEGIVLQDPTRMNIITGFQFLLEDVEKSIPHAPAPVTNPPATVAPPSGTTTPPVAPTVHPTVPFIRKKEIEGNRIVDNDVNSGIAASRGGGNQLPGSTLNFMQSRFGADFSGVHIHTGDYAVQLSKGLNAHAFTVGNDIYFNSGRFAPESTAGRQLLAHELTHVVQQGGDGGMVQRSEVDDRSCVGLTDIEPDINTKVRTEITAARTAAGASITGQAALLTFLGDVMNRLGSGPISPIEHFVESLPLTKQKPAPQNLVGTKYENVSSVNRFYKLQTAGLAHVVGSSANIHGYCVGADKLGHFFEEGFAYFQIAHMTGKTVADAIDAGHALEIGIQGLGATGVYSNADQAANLAGMQFYNDLLRNPSGYNFDIASYISDRWNEQNNPSFYAAAEGGVVWNNLLAGTWKGEFLPTGSTTSIDLAASLTVSGGVVSGTYNWPATGPGISGTISNGVITQRTIHVGGTFPGKAPVADDPVSGITIEFDWAEGSKKGKGSWTSANEQTLKGSYGSVASRTNGGAWNMTKS